MFKHFPTNYVWNLWVDLAIEMGASIGDVDPTLARSSIAMNTGALQ